MDEGQCTVEGYDRVVMRKGRTVTVIVIRKNGVICVRWDKDQSSRKQVL